MHKPCINLDLYLYVNAKKLYIFHSSYISIYKKRLNICIHKGRYIHYSALQSDILYFGDRSLLFSVLLFLCYGILSMYVGFLCFCLFFPRFEWPYNMFCKKINKLFLETLVQHIEIGNIYNWYFLYLITTRSMSLLME